MAETKGKLYLAFKKEKDPKMRSRMLAVHMVRNRGLGVEETAENLMQSPNWVRMWVGRYDQGGFDALRDLPKSGRPRSISRETVDQLVGEAVRSRCTPEKLQRHIHDETGTKLHITYVRKIMRARRLTPKEPQKVHINRAGKKAVQGWQYRFRKLVPRLAGEGFTILDEDEAFFVHDTVSGRKYWSPQGEPITVPYTGSHRKIAVYGATAKDGRQFFRTYDRFNAPTFVKYLNAMQRHFGKVAVVMDRASPHRAKLVKKLLRENKNIRVIYLPKGSPYLNATEECWHQGKRVLLVSEYYRTFADMCKAISLYYRTARFKLDILKYANRKAVLFSKNI